MRPWATNLILRNSRLEIGKENTIDSTKPGAGFWEQGGGTLGAIPNWRPGNYSVNICGYPGIKGVLVPWRSFDATLKSPSENGFKSKMSG